MYEIFFLFFSLSLPPLSLRSPIVAEVKLGGTKRKKNSRNCQGGVRLECRQKESNQVSTTKLDWSISGQSKKEELSVCGEGIVKFSLQVVQIWCKSFSVLITWKNFQFYPIKHFDNFYSYLLLLCSALPQFLFWFRNPK